MNDIYVIGDVHGHYNDLVELINKLPNKFESKICFVGDLIDRGPDSKKVVDLVKKYNYDCVLGNHEQMCIEHAVTLIIMLVDMDKPFLIILVQMVE